MGAPCPAGWPASSLTPWALAPTLATRTTRPRCPSLSLRKRAAPELAEPSEPYVRGDLTIDYAQRRVTMAGRPVALTGIEYRMLVELSVNAGRALTHEHLLQRVWRPDKGEDSGPVRNIIKRLRRKLGDDPGNSTFILTEPSVGYRMEKGEVQERETE